MVALRLTCGEDVSLTMSTPVAHCPPAVQARDMTLAAMFLRRVEASAEREAYRFPVGARWESRTWAQVGEQVSRVAAGLVALGVQPGERVAIAAATSYEWIVADLGVVCAGAVTTTVYPSSLPEDVAFILSDSDSRVVFAEDATQLKKLRQTRAELPGIRAVVLLAATQPEVATTDDWVLTLDQLEQLGQDHLDSHQDAVGQRVGALTGDDLATLIYTSGTTGRPKGVRLSQSAWTYEGAAVASLDILDIDDLQYLWLPLAHSFGKVLLTTQLAIGMPTAVDGRVERIASNLEVVRPTWMGAAPRIFEKAYGRILGTARSEGRLKAGIFDWACSVGARVSDIRRQGGGVPPALAAQHRIADKLVFAKVRARFGGRVKFFISGSAGLNSDVAEWFHAAGITILEGYGLTETSAGSAVNLPDRLRIGSVGIPLPGTEMRLAADGELLVRGPGVMQGYHNLDEATAEVLSPDGWLATGDIGEVDGDGFVSITDRKKDLFKTSGGKYVAPSKVEAQFKALCPLVSQILVHGEGRNFCTAVLALDPDAVDAWATRTGRHGWSYGDAVTSTAMRDDLLKYVDALNARLNRWEQIKKYVVLEKDITVESGELTPSMKLKRRVVEHNNRDTLDAFYQ